MSNSSRDPEDFYKRHYRPYPWSPGYRILPPWLFLPTYLVVFVLVWLGVTFAVKGQWHNVVLSLAIVLSIGSVYATWMRIASKRAGIPVGFREWRDHVDRTQDEHGS